MELKKMKSIIVSVITAAGLMAAGSVLATDMPELAKKSGCTACHKIDAKLVGPAWMDVSKKYKGVKEYAFSPTGSAAAGAKKMSLEEGLIMKVSKGGTGNWGSVPMIANSPKVSDADIKTLVHFVLDLAK
jgi:cytochrome c